MSCRGSSLWLPKAILYSPWFQPWGNEWELMSNVEYRMMNDEERKKKKRKKKKRKELRFPTSRE